MKGKGLIYSFVIILFVGNCIADDLDELRSELVSLDHKYVRMKQNILIEFYQHTSETDQGECKSHKAFDANGRKDCKFSNNSHNVFHISMFHIQAELYMDIAEMKTKSVSLFNLKLSQVIWLID